MSCTSWLVAGGISAVNTSDVVTSAGEVVSVSFNLIIILRGGDMCDGDMCGGGMRGGDLRGGDFAISQYEGGVVGTTGRRG